jgi:RNA polymerase sporulation-specific sigma factor
MNKANGFKKFNWNKYYVSNDEALALVKIYKEAPLERKKLIKEIILKRLDYLVYAKIKGYKNKACYEDLLQEGKLGLLKAVEDFDITRGINFFKYARWHIQSCITRLTKRYKREEAQKRRVMKDQIDNYEDEVGPDIRYELLESFVVLRRAMSNLPDIDRNVLIMRFGINGSNEYTLKQIGETFSLTKQRIAQIEKKAISKIKKDKEFKNFFCELL